MNYVYILVSVDKEDPDGLPVTIGVYTSEIKALEAINDTFEKILETEDVDDDELEEMLNDTEFSDFIKIKKVPLDTRFLKHELDYVDENDEDYFFDTCEEVPLRTMKEVLDILEEG